MHFSTLRELGCFQIVIHIKSLNILLASLVFNLYLVVLAFTLTFAASLTLFLRTLLHQTLLLSFLLLFYDQPLSLLQFVQGIKLYHPLLLLRSFNQMTKFSQNLHLKISFTQSLHSNPHPQA